MLGFFHELAWFEFSPILACVLGTVQIFSNAFFIIKEQVQSFKCTYDQCHAKYVI